MNRTKQQEEFEMEKIKMATPIGGDGRRRDDKDSLEDDQG